MVPSVSLGKYLSERAYGLNCGLLAKNKQTNKNIKARIRPFPIVLVKCWKVAHWNAKRLLKNCQKSKKLLTPKFQKLLPKFLDNFV